MVSDERLAALEARLAHLENTVEKAKKLIRTMGGAKGKLILMALGE